MWIFEKGSNTQFGLSIFKVNSFLQCVPKLSTFHLFPTYHHLSVFGIDFSLSHFPNSSLGDIHVFFSNTFYLVLYHYLKLHTTFDFLCILIFLLTYLNKIFELNFVILRKVHHSIFNMSYTFNITPNLLQLRNI